MRLQEIDVTCDIGFLIQGISPDDSRNGEVNGGELTDRLRVVKLVALVCKDGNASM